MLKITIPSSEMFNEITREFIYSDGGVLTLEHSLISVSKWEAKFHKPFINPKKNEVRTTYETIEYIKCMTITQNVNPNIYNGINNEIINKVNDYINDPMTATIVSDSKIKKKNTQFVTSELIYYWMVAHGIPFECEKWHLNRLITLIKVCNAENSKGSKANKLSKSEIARSNAEINAARRKALNSKG